MENYTIELENVSKNIKEKKIISNLSFKIKEGDILGFLGPNGAGKTTVVRMIMGLTKPTSGVIKVNGYNIQEEPSKALAYIGGIVSSPSFYVYLTGIQNLRQKARFFYDKISDTELIQILNTVGLHDSMDTKVDQYSLGMKQRLGIALALVGNPKTIVLDEPINGMDPEGVIEIRNLLKKLSKENKITILMSSHLLSELENVADHILIINKGKKLFSSSIEGLYKNENKQIIEFEKEQKQIIKDIGDRHKLNYAFNGNEWQCQLGQREFQNILKELLEKEVILKSYKEDKGTLEEIYLDILKREKEAN